MKQLALILFLLMCAVDSLKRAPTDPWYRLPSTLGALATVGGLRDGAERLIQ